VSQNLSLFTGIWSLVGRAACGVIGGSAACGQESMLFLILRRNLIGSMIYLMLNDMGGFLSIILFIYNLTRSLHPRNSRDMYQLS